MLLLTRYIGQSIIINGDITVKIMNVNNNQVFVGIAAPEGISVHREEIQRKIDNERLFNELNYEALK